MSNVGEVVTSVGNSWIICRSKSYMGRIYYFNTSTGEAAWNLNEIEVEKAKKRTKSLQCQPGFTMDNCPEPLESPAGHSELETLQSYKYRNRNYLQGIPKVYNKQIINNQFTKPPDLYSSAVIQCSPTAFNIPITSPLNTAIWTVAPQQIFVTPSVSPSQLHNTYNIEYVPVTNTSMTLTNRFKKIAEVDHRYSILKQDGLQNDKYQQKLKIDDGSSKNDLRLFLSLKRAENILKNNETRQSDCKGPIHQYDQNNDAKGTGFHINENDGCLEELSQDHIQEININSLRSFLQVKEHTVLYIVTDSNVLLNNIHFLSDLLRGELFSQ